MDAVGASGWSGNTRNGSAGGIAPAKLPRIAIVSSLALLAAAGLMLVGRRLSGALETPPPVGFLAIIGLGLALAAASFRWACRDVTSGPAWRFLLAAAPSVVIGLWFAALGFGETSGWGAWVLLAPVFLEEGWGWGRWRRHEASVWLGREEDLVEPPMVTEEVWAAAVSKAPGPLAEEATDEVSDHVSRNVVQHQARRRDDRQGEVLEGWTRVAFAAGQRHAAAHIAICPPLGAVPTCYAEVGDGPEASVKVTGAMPFGVRLEVKLETPADEPADIVVEYAIVERVDKGEA